MKQDCRRRLAAGMRSALALLALGPFLTAGASTPAWRGAEIRQLAQSATQPETVYAEGMGFLYRSDDRGRTWNPLRLPVPSSNIDLHVDPDDARHVLILVRGPDTNDKTSLHESFDRGVTWTERTSIGYAERDGSAGGTFSPSRLAVRSDDRRPVWWAHDGRQWFRSADGAKSWVRDEDGRFAANAVHGGSMRYSLDGTTLWRAGSGEQWQKVHEFDSPAKPGQRRRSPSNLLALDDGVLVVRDQDDNWLQSNDRGLNWTPSTNGFQQLNRQRPGAESSASTSSPPGYTSCHAHRSPNRAGTLIAQCVWSDGVRPSVTCLHVSADAGKTWTPPREAAGFPGPGCQLPGLPPAWAPTALLMDAKDPSRMLVAWQAGGLFRTDDGGQSWSPSDAGLMFRNGRQSSAGWAAVNEPPLIQAVLLRDRDLLERTLASGADINVQGTHLGGVLDADLAARELEIQDKLPVAPLMWEQLRRAGATSVVSPGPDRRLLTRAFHLKLPNVVDDAIRLGYDWGARTTPIGRSDWPRPPEGELHDLLRQGERFGLTAPRVGQLVSAYLGTGKFPSADQTTLDLLENGYPDLAAQVFLASSRGSPFDQQSTRRQVPDQLIGIALLQAGKSAPARQVFASFSPAALRTETRQSNDLVDAIASGCDLDEAAWYKARGLEMQLSWTYERCLSDKKYPESTRLRILEAMDRDGGIPPESWKLWLNDEDRRWVRQTALYAQALRDEQNRGTGIVGISLDFDPRSDNVLVFQTIAGLPADAEGVRRGDEITSVDGHPTQHQTLGQIARRLGGQPGTWVDIDVLRDGRPMKFRLQRQARPPQAGPPPAQPE